jgi:hemolysin activation/secretion protein
MVTGSGTPPRSSAAPFLHLLFALLALAGATSPRAQAPAAPPMASVAPSPVFVIKGFQVTGDNPLGPAETDRVLAPFQRPDATLETLQKATAAFESALREKGFGLHRVALPPQEVGERVRLDVVKFTLARVHIAGRSLYDEGNIRRSLPDLREGESPNFKRLAIQTAIANENPNKQVEVSLREGDQADRIDATVSVKESRPWMLAFGLSNAGSESSGQDRLTVMGGHTNLFNLDHQFTGAYTTSLERPGDVKQLGLAYKAPLYRWGAVLGASYTRSDVVGNFGTFTSTGAGHTAGASAAWYLPPQGGRRSYVTLGIEDRLFEAAVINDVVIGADRRSRHVTLGYTARTASDTSVWGYNLDLAANSGGGSHNDLASYQDEDPRITTSRWKALRGGASYSAALGQTWRWSARGQFQYSRDVLISGEQFGLGGLGSVRGTRTDRAITGDKGLSASLEVTTPELSPGWRLLGFLDAGWLGNNKPNGVNELSSDRLASAGLGLRYGNDSFVMALDYGRVIRGSRLPAALNSESPQRGDDRLYLSVSWRF